MALETQTPDPQEMLKKTLEMAKPKEELKKDVDQIVVKAKEGLPHLKTQIDKAASQAKKAIDRMSWQSGQFKEATKLAAQEEIDKIFDENGYLNKKFDEARDKIQILREQNLSLPTAKLVKELVDQADNIYGKMNGKLHMPAVLLKDDITKLLSKLEKIDMKPYAKEMKENEAQKGATVLAEGIKGTLGENLTKFDEGGKFDLKSMEGKMEALVGHLHKTPGLFKEDERGIKSWEYSTTLVGKPMEIKAYMIAAVDGDGKKNPDAGQIRVVINYGSLFRYDANNNVYVPRKDVIASAFSYHEKSGMELGKESVDNIARMKKKEEQYMAFVNKKQLGKMA